MSGRARTPWPPARPIPTTSDTSATAASYRGGAAAGRRGSSLPAGLLAPAPGEASSTGCPDGKKPEVFPAAGLTPGITGTVLTVIKGHTPVPFDVEILGILPSGIAPGVDFVLIQVSGTVIDQTGGIAAGMSGSPVFIDGKLAGAVAYGFFAADKTIGGMTPAQPMLDILDYPGGVGAFDAAAALAGGTEIDLSPRLRRVAANASGVTTAEFPSTARHLPVPLAVSGLNGRAMGKLARMIERGGLPLLPVRASASSPAGRVSATPFEPGEAMAATLSVGDLTVAGIGTVTAACGDRSVHFGHPFLFQGALRGRTAMGMHAAEVVSVVKDPSGLFGAFKVATVAELRGSIDQDRLAGIRGVAGISPPVVPVVTRAAGPDLGKVRHGRTDVFTQEQSFFGFTFPVLPFTAAFHLLANQDVVFDRIGDGSVAITFTVRGLGPSGEGFRLRRRNIHVSGSDASFQGILELLAYLEILVGNPFGEVELTSVRATSTITQARLVSRIRSVRSASARQPALKQRRVLRVRRGGRIRLRVALRSPETGRVVREELALRAPWRRGRGSLVVRGGRPGDICLFCEVFDDGFEGGLHEGGGGLPAASFEGLLWQLRGAERNNDLVVRARVGGRQRKAPDAQDFVVRGRRTVRLVVG